MKKDGDHVDLSIDHILADEALRHRLFPVTQKRIFLAHAGVAPLPGPTVERLKHEAERASFMQEGPDFMAEIEGIRRVAARLINAESDEVALLGPTSLGLNLVANGLKWKEGDEVIFYPDDYPANVYPWQALAEQGVRVIPLQPERPGGDHSGLGPEGAFAADSSGGTGFVPFPQRIPARLRGDCRGAESARRAFLPGCDSVARSDHGGMSGISTFSRPIPINGCWGRWAPVSFT